MISTKLLTRVWFVIFVFISVYSRIADYLSTLASSPPSHSPWFQKRILLFINPYSGQGLAKKIYQQLVEPVFLQHQIELTVVETQYAQHILKIRRIILVNMHYVY